MTILMHVQLNECFLGRAFLVITDSGRDYGDAVVIGRYFNLDKANSVLKSYTSGNRLIAMVDESNIVLEKPIALVNFNNELISRFIEAGQIFVKNIKGTFRDIKIQKHN